MLLALAVSAHAAEPPADLPAALAAWRADRVAEVAGESGWLTVVALHFLKDGDNAVGGAPGSDIVVPGLAARAGRFVVSGRAVRFVAEPGGGVQDGDHAAGVLDVTPADGEAPRVLAAGSLRLLVIERGGRFALRVRDLASRARREFKGLDYFPVDPAWALDARFEPYTPARHVPITNVLGMEIDMLSPGAIVFARDGREWRLDALLEAPGDDHLFVMFADATSGHGTYGAGRFLYVPLPAGRAVRVDFNRAYNPPCAFTGFATCPLPPPQNRLALAVRAGELAYAGAAH